MLFTSTLIKVNLFMKKGLFFNAFNILTTKLTGSFCNRNYVAHFINEGMGYNCFQKGHSTIGLVHSYSSVPLKKASSEITVEELDDLDRRRKLVKLSSEKIKEFLRYKDKLCESYNLYNDEIFALYFNLHPYDIQVENLFYLVSTLNHFITQAYGFREVSIFESRRSFEYEEIIFILLNDYTILQKTGLSLSAISTLMGLLRNHILQHAEIYKKINAVTIPERKFAAISIIVKRVKLSYQRLSIESLGYNSDNKPNSLLFELALTRFSSMCLHVLFEAGLVIPDRNPKDILELSRQYEQKHKKHFRPFLIQAHRQKAAIMDNYLFLKLPYIYKDFLIKLQEFECEVMDQKTHSSKPKILHVDAEKEVHVSNIDVNIENKPQHAVNDNEQVPNSNASEETTNREQDTIQSFLLSCLEKAQENETLNTNENINSNTS